MTCCSASCPHNHQTPNRHLASVNGHRNVLLGRGKSPRSLCRRRDVKVWFTSMCKDSALELKLYMTSFFFLSLVKRGTVAFMQLCAADRADCCLWPCGKQHFQSVWSSWGLCENDGSRGLLREFKANIRLLAWAELNPRSSFVTGPSLSIIVVDNCTAGKDFVFFDLSLCVFYTCKVAVINSGVPPLKVVFGSKVNC